jgi:hypothetical protein
VNSRYAPTAGKRWNTCHQSCRDDAPRVRCRVACAPSCGMMPPLSGVPECLNGDAERNADGPASEG